MVVPHFEFEWDPRKSEANKRKHGVDFTEAASVFYNPLAAIFPDETHSEEEGREIMVGRSKRNRLLMIAFTERDFKIRIISARRATPRERGDYENFRLRP